MIGRRVLLIEDNPVTRQLAHVVLNAAGIVVFEAARGADALELAGSCKPDLVLLDLLLPDMSSFELLEALRVALGPQVPILAFTGRLSSLDEGRLLGAGFDDVITKPFEPKRLREILRAYLPAQAPLAPDFGARRKVLVVDDDAVQRKLVSYRLARLGFEVTSVDGAQEALRVAQAHVPDVIVSDVLMPRVDGFELCALLRANVAFASTAIILLTNSYVEEADRTLAAKVGADAFVVRTHDLQGLSDALQKVLGGSDRTAPERADAGPEVQRERAARVLRQLDRQVALNALLTQRSAMLSAELAILSGLTSALAEHRDASTALDAALSACFDAGGIAWGLLLVRDDAKGWRYRSVELRDDRLNALDGTASELAARLQLDVASKQPREIQMTALFAGGAEGTALLVPIVHRDRVLGAIVLGMGDALDDHRIAFAKGVAGQIGLALVLSESFAELESVSEAERARARVLESTLNTIREPIIVLDRGSVPVRWNSAAEEVVRTKFQGASEQWPERMGLYRADQATRFQQQDRPSVRALRGENVDDEELFVNDGSGEPQWVSVTARPIFGEASRVDGAVMMFRDVTAEKHAQAQQITSDRMASVGALAAGVAHEINNPLTSVLAELEMAMQDLEPTHRSFERLHAAHDAAQRVRTIVRDLRTLSRGEADDLGPVDLSRVIETAVRMATPQTRDCATVECALEPLLWTLGNEARLVQVFLNLLVNAAQAIGSGSAESNWIRVRASAQEAGGLAAEVSDTGSGMSAEVKSRLFTPFFTTKPVGMGTGLGLSISHRIVTSMGGRLECDSARGKGTTFRLWFPALAGAMTGEHSGVRGADLGRRQRVLVIDEDPLVRQLAVRTLRAGFRVAAVRSLAEALARFASEPPYALVLCDANLEDPAGELAWRQLSRLPAATHVALMGPLRGTETTDLPRLARPFDARRLDDFVRKILRLTPKENPQ